MWISKPTLTAFLFATLVGCGSLSELGGFNAATTLELSGTPSVAYDPATGKTSVILQFIARSQVGGSEEAARAIAPDQVDATLRINGQTLDNESLTKEDAQALSTSVVYGLVLDSSYSMTQHKPSAFEPMKAAAKASVDHGAQLWASRSGQFTSLVSWFDEFVYTQEGLWHSSDILSIPTPPAGTATRLFAAVDAMAARLQALHDSGTAAGERDRHLMLVFSDGEDNLSWFDNAEVSQRLVTSTGASYVKSGAPSVTLKQALDRVKAHPRLTVHVIGLGSTVNQDELRAIASAGGGQYFANPVASEIDQVFERVTREFASLQTIGATIPIPPGQYALELWVTPKDGSAPAHCRLSLTAGENAQISSACDAE